MNARPGADSERGPEDMMPLAKRRLRPSLMKKQHTRRWCEVTEKVPQAGRYTGFSLVLPRQEQA